MFTGTGGIEMGVNPVFGSSTAWHCEIAPGPVALLAHRYPTIPNHGDVRRVDWNAVEPVDLLTAGFPCQPVSNAGKKKGTADVRWLWPSVRDAVAALRPRWVFLENVSAIVRGDRGGHIVVGDLAALGYVAEWACVRASQVGAPHHRERWMCLARSADSVDDGHEWSRPSWDRWPESPDGSLRDLWYGTPYFDAVCAWERVAGPVPRPVMAADDLRPCPPFIEWMMGLPAGHVTAVPGLSRTAILRMLGNGVVPQQASYAAVNALKRFS